MAYADSPTWTIDLWHNLRGGYRARYYVYPKRGDDANDYALDVSAQLRSV